MGGNQTECTKQSNFRELISNIDSVILPSSLWAVHVHPEGYFIAVILINQDAVSGIRINKGLIIKQNTDDIGISIFINGELVEIPSINKRRVCKIEDLSDVVFEFDFLKICRGYPTTANYKCLLFVEDENTHFCTQCKSFAEIQRKNEEITSVKNVSEETANYIKETNDEISDDNYSKLEMVWSDTTLFQNDPLISQTHSSEYPDNIVNELLKVDYKNCTDDKIKNDGSIVVCTSKLVCHLCGVYFKDSVDLDKHLLIHNVNYRDAEKNSKLLNKFKCKLCLKHFKTEKNLQKHKRTHFNVDQNIPCDTLNSADVLKDNRKPHDVHSATIICEVCKKTFTRSSHLKVHMRKHSGERPFLCEFCDKKFITKSHLKEHVRLHTGEKPYVCSVCNKASSHLSAHQRHLLTHSGVKPNLCTICGKTFCKGYRLQDHMLTHSNSKPYECEICQKRFSKHINLKIHGKTHTGQRPYICSFCGKTYTTQSNLSTHISSHTGHKPHECGACHKSFVHPRLLRIHMRVHTGEKPYKCQQCDKAFAKNVHLTVHTRTHTGERPYVCVTCKKGFTTSGNLSAHHRVHHRDV